jgi:hypothetical protein
MSKTYEAYAVHENGDRTVYAGLTRARALARYGQFTREVRDNRYGSSGPIKSWGWRLEP